MSSVERNIGSAQRSHPRPSAIHDNLTRAELEKDYNQRVTQLRNIYEMRIQAIHEGVKTAFKLVQSDDLIDTMKHDVTSEDFINQRVKEIIEEVLYNEREAVLEKISHQYSFLRSEFTKLEQENLRVINDIKEMEAEYVRRLDEVHSKLDHETKSREFYQSESDSLKKAIEELNQDYENTLKKKEEFWNKKSHMEGSEIYMLKDKINELESLLKEKDSSNHRLHIDLESLQKQVEGQRNKINERDYENSILRSDKNALETKNAELNRQVTELETIRNDNRRAIQELNDQISHWRSESVRTEQQKQNLEEKVKKQIEDLNKDFRAECDTIKDNSEKIQKKSKEKNDQLKKKVLEQKEKLGEKENSIQELNRRIDEERIINQKNAEIYQLKIQELKETYDHKNSILEEDHHRKMNDLQLRHEEQIRDLQTHFQGLLEKKVTQIQDEASDQILTLKDQEEELQGLLEEKMIQLDKDYVKITFHEEALEDKNQIIDKLKKEILIQENEYKLDLAQKLKNLEDKFLEELDFEERKHRNAANLSEDNIARLENDKKRLEDEIESRNEKIKQQQAQIDELDLQRKKLFDTIEDWGVKSKKIKNAYDDEFKRREALEAAVHDQQEKYQEIATLFRETKKDIEEKNQQIKYLTAEVENYELSMSAQAKQYKIIQREFEDLKRDFAQTDNQKNEMIRTLQEDNEIAAREIKGLNDKIVEVMRASAEKYEAELSAHFDSKNKIKLLESKLQEIQYELDDSNHKLMLCGQSSEELSNYINDLKFKLSGKENDIRALAKEKGDLRNKIDTYLLQIGEMKKNFQVYLMAKMREIRIELRDLKNYQGTVLSNLMKEDEYKITELINLFRVLQDRRQENYFERIQQMKSELKTDYDMNLDNFKEKYDRQKMELSESYEQRLFDKEKRLDNLKEENTNLRDRAHQLENEIEHIQANNNNLREECMRLQNEVAKSLKEKEDMNAKLTQYKQKVSGEIQSINDELVRVNEEFIREKEGLIAKHEEELRALHIQIENVRAKHALALQEHERKLEELSKDHLEAVQRLRDEHVDQADYLREQLARGQRIEKELNDRITRLSDDKLKVEKQLVLIEAEKLSLKDGYEKQLQLFEGKMFEVEQTIHKEASKQEDLKAEKKREIGNLNRAIQALQDENKLKGDRINELSSERTKLQQTIQDLTQQMDHKNAQIEQQRQEIALRTKEKAREIENLHQLLSKSYTKSVQDSFEINPNEKSHIISTALISNKSVEDLKKLNHYLSQSRSPTYKTSQDKSPIRLSTLTPVRVETDGDHQKPTKNLSISQLKHNQVYNSFSL